MKRIKKVVTVVCFLLLGLLFVVGTEAEGLYSSLHLYESVSTKDNPNVILKTDDVINILLLGSDHRRGKSASNQRSDAIMVCSVNKSNENVCLLSFLRDTYVDIPDHGKGKINSSFSLGGPKLVAETITLNYGLQIDAFVLLDFMGFRNLINSLGGVEVELTKAEATELNRSRYIKAKYHNFRPGSFKLNGAQALVYSRIRHGESSKGFTPLASMSGKIDDLGRAERQRLVLEAIISKIKDQSLLELRDTLKETASYISTDLERFDILKLLYFAFSKDVNIKQYQVPVNFSFKTINGQSCIVPKLTSEQKRLKVLYK